MIRATRNDGALIDITDSECLDCDELKADNDRLLNLCKSIHYQYCASVCPVGDHHEATCQDINASIK